MNATVLIETHVGGHHLMYLRVMSQILLGLGHQVVIFYTEPQQVLDWITTACPEHLHRIKVLPVVESRLSGKFLPRKLLPRKLPQPLQVLARWQAAAAMAKIAASVLERSSDLVLFNWLDDLFSAYLPHQIIDQVFPYAWAGLCFQPRLWSPQAWLDHHEALNAHHCRGCGVLDEGMAAQLQQRVRAAVIPFPDFTDEVAADPTFVWVDQLKQRAQGRKIVALLGALHRRKGLLTLLETALRSQSEPWLFAFIGELSTYTLSAEDQARVQAIAADPPENCFFRLQRIPDEAQFNALVNASDILFAAYENFPYSSNLLTKAAVFQTPVIVSDRYCMGERVREFQLGIAIEEGNVDHCRNAIQTLGDDTPHNFVGYHQRHSVERLQLAMQEMLSHA